jgi:hypothetical protein
MGGIEMEETTAKEKVEVSIKCDNCKEEIYACYTFHKCKHYFKKGDKIYCRETPSGINLHYCEVCGPQEIKND